MCEGAKSHETAAIISSPALKELVVFGKRSNDHCAKVGAALADANQGTRRPLSSQSGLLLLFL